MAVAWSTRLPATYPLGAPDGMDRFWMEACAFMDRNEEDPDGPAAYRAAGMPDFMAAQVPADPYSGKAELRLELEGQAPVRFTSSWPAWERPEEAPAKGARQRSRPTRRLRPQRA